MSTTDYQNQEALNKALNIYRTYMRAFIIFHLKKIPGQKVEDIIIDSLDDAGQSNRADEIDRLLSQSNRDIKSIIDIDDFPRLVNANWNSSFKIPLNDDKTFRNQLWLIKDGRDQSWAHPPEGDAESEGTRAYLFLIADVLRKIKKPDKQSEVEAIRDELFSDDTAERLEKVEEDNVEYKRLLAEVEQRLATAESEKNGYAEKNAALSKEVDGKENQRKKLDKQLKRAKAQNDKYKKDIAGKNQHLKESEEARDDYKNRLEVESKELKGTKTKLKETEERLAAAQAAEKGIAARLRAVQNLFTVATIGEREVQEVFQSIYPPIETNSTVRILDRRDVGKKNYLLELLEQKDPTIIYVQSGEMADLLLERVIPEKADSIEKHIEQTSESEETEILERLENGELIAVVSDTTLSTLASSHCIEHFVFCHLVPSLDRFFKQCEPAFTSGKNSYLHLVYNREQDIEGLNQWLVQKYPDAEALGELYRELRKLVETDSGFIKAGNVYDENIYSKLGMAKLGVETGLAIFEELQFLERDEKGVKLLPDPEKRDLDESEIHGGGEELKQGIAEVQTFQLKQPIEQIWEEILEKLNVDSEQILRESNIHKIDFKVLETKVDVQSTIGTEQDKVTPPTPEVWPQRTLSAFDSLRQRASKNLHNTNNFIQSIDESTKLNSPVVELREVDDLDFHAPDPIGEYDDYENKYDLAMQFAQEHGVNALKQGIALLIENQGNPDYDFTEDETNMLRAFQNACEDSQTQSNQFTETVESDSVMSSADTEVEHVPKPARANAKVTEEQVREIRSRSAAGESNSELAKEFDLSPTAVRNIVLRKTWRDVK